MSVHDTVGVWKHEPYTKDNPRYRQREQAYRHISHHIESRRTGGDAPNNLITLCETCHKGYHKGTVTLPKKIHRGMSFRDAAFMGIMRWAVYEKLKDLYPNVRLTYGYITKTTRIGHGLPKAHHVDARCISGNTDAAGTKHVTSYGVCGTFETDMFMKPVIPT